MIEVTHYDKLHPLPPPPTASPFRGHRRSRRKNPPYRPRRQHPQLPAGDGGCGEVDVLGGRRPDPAGGYPAGRPHGDQGLPGRGGGGPVAAAAAGAGAGQRRRPRR